MENRFCIGDTLKLKRSGERIDEIFECIIEDIDEEQVITKIKKETLILTFPRAGEKLETVSEKKEMVYLYKGKVVVANKKSGMIVLEISEENKSIQRRKYKRIPIKAMVNYKLLRAGEGTINKAVGTNLSSGGIYIITGKYLNVGEKLALSFENTSGEPITGIKGIIVRQEMMYVGDVIKRLGYGIEFIDMTEKMRQMITEFMIKYNSGAGKK